MCELSSAHLLINLIVTLPPSMVFRWVFIPWLQRELDNYTHRVNNTAKRTDRNKILPHGIPNHIYESPETYGALDFKVRVI